VTAQPAAAPRRRATTVTAEDALGRLVRGHMPALDGLRGIAILLVLAHGFDVIQTRGGPGHDVDLVLDVGWIGVQLFFVLSGFLITGILLDTRSSPHYFRKFWVRRALRIFPLYYGVLLVAALFGHGSIYLWTYTNNFATAFGHGDPTFPHFWSLAVEEQFYLLWPLVVWLVARRGVVALSVALSALAIASRIYARHRWGYEAAYEFTPCRMDALAIGAGTAALIRSDRWRRFVANRNAAGLGIIGGVIIRWSGTSCAPARRCRASATRSSLSGSPCCSSARCRHTARRRPSCRGARCERSASTATACTCSTRRSTSSSGCRSSSACTGSRARRSASRT